MKKLIIALMLSAAILIPQAKAADECHSIKELITSANQKSDIKFVQRELSPVDTVKFLNNIRDMFATDIDGIVHVYVIQPKGENHPDDVFIVMADVNRCIISGGDMDSNTFEMMMQ